MTKCLVVLLLVLPTLVWAFDTPTLRDNFERADGGLGSNWSGSLRASQDNSTLQIDNGGVRRGLNNTGSAWWNPTVFGPNVATGWRLRDGTSASGHYIDLYVRLQSPGTEGVDGYVCNFQPDNELVRIFRMTNNNVTQISTTAVVTLSTTDLLGCEAIGTTITAWHNSGGTGGWEAVSTATDTTYSGAGFVGYRTNTNAYVVDDFRADTLTAAVTRRGVPLMAQ